MIIDKWCKLCLNCPLLECSDIGRDTTATSCLPISAADAAGLTADLAVALLEQLDYDLWQYEEATNKMADDLVTTKRRYKTKPVIISPEAMVKLDRPFTTTDFKKATGLPIMKARTMIQRAVDLGKMKQVGVNRRGGVLFEINRGGGYVGL